MKIVKLRLCNYKRFPLLTDTSVTIEPDHKMIYILGTNGSGKSSLVKELSPLPPTPQDYLPGGYKYIELEHNGKFYILNSKVSTGLKNSFIIDGVELNPSGTTQIQKELCYSHFTLDSHTHELMTGVKQFTDMSVNDRRYWFTKLSNINIDFAMSKYGEYKELLKEVETEFKIRTSMLYNEKTKLLDGEDISNMLKNIDILNNQILDENDVNDCLLRYVKSSTNDPRAGVVNLNSKLRLFIKHNGKRLRTPLEELKPTLSNRAEEHLILQTKYNAANQEYLLLTKQINTLKDNTPTENEETLLSDKQLTCDLINNSKTTLKFLTLPELDKEVMQNTLRTVYSDIKTLQSDLIPLMQDMPYNVGQKVYNKPLRKTYIDKLDYLNKELTAQKKSLTRDVQNLSNLDDLLKLGYVTCPNCKHSWINKYDKELHDRLLKDVEITTVTISHLETTKEEYTLKLGSVDNYIKLYETVLLIKNKTSECCKPMWGLIDNQQLIFDNPSNVIGIINMYSKDFNGYKYIYDQLVKLDRIELELSKIGMKNTNEIEYLEKLKATKEQEINILTKEYNLSTKLKTKLEETVKITEQFLLLKKEIHLLYSSLETYKDEQVIMSIVDKLNLSISEKTIKINTLLTNIKHNDNTTTVVEEHQNALDKLETRRYVLDTICKELSPKDGLIAKTLNQFIVAFVGNINTFINFIWTYPMVIMADIDDVNMDYKFKVKVNDDLIVHDISKGSKGMQEIINLSFRLTAMAYLKIQHYPLFLDEFGTHLDTEHRRKAFDAITNLSYYSNHSQIFLISHHEQSYSGLSKADVVLLNHDNIRLPDNVTYNSILHLS